MTRCYTDAEATSYFQLPLARLTSLMNGSCTQRLTTHVHPKEQLLHAHGDVVHTLVIIIIIIITIMIITIIDIQTFTRSGLWCHHGQLLAWQW
jgi:hypothetical protein